MNITIDQQGNSKVAIIESDGIVINNSQDALDLMASVRYSDDADKLIIEKSNITEEFFELKPSLQARFCRNT